MLSALLRGEGCSEEAETGLAALRKATTVGEGSDAVLQAVGHSSGQAGPSSFAPPVRGGLPACGAAEEAFLRAFHHAGTDGTSSYEGAWQAACLQQMNGDNLAGPSNEYMMSASRETAAPSYDMMQNVWDTQQSFGEPRSHANLAHGFYETALQSEQLETPALPLSSLHVSASSMPSTVSFEQPEYSSCLNTERGQCSESGTATASAQVKDLEELYEKAWDNAQVQPLIDAYSDLQHQVPSNSALSFAPTQNQQRSKDVTALVTRSTLDRAWAENLAASEATLQAAWEDAVQTASSSADGFNLDGLWESLQASGFEDVWSEALGRQLDEYAFRDDNPFLGQPGLLQRGIELFQAGELRQAILALEAAVQADAEDSIAWQTLGQAHADSDDDARAIACLRRAVTADPHNLEALLSLGVSYTNELDQTRAVEHLQHWIESHPDFVNLSSLESPPARRDPFTLQRQVTALFERARSFAPDNADLHAVLGVLHNLARDYTQAVESFERALHLRPNDYSLWNKLGATQANAMSCEAALPCYVRALQLKPQYVRALSNLGISYGNMGSHEDAARCYLKALSLNSGASHVWSYLAMTFTSMGRPDLVTKTQQTDCELFREDFDF
uniref:Peroxin-5 n=1 Tax=Chrysotila carterae TaxID=13221 RepID=A0A7S4BWN4_CHRCT